MSWTLRAARNYVLTAALVVFAWTIYIGVTDPQELASRRFSADMFVLIILLVVFLGLPTLALAWIVARFTGGVAELWKVRLLTLLMTFWLPLLLIFVMIEAREFAFAVGAQVIFACTLPSNRKRPATSVTTAPD